MFAEFENQMLKHFNQNVGNAYCLFSLIIFLNYFVKFQNEKTKIPKKLAKNVFFEEKIKKN